jgi:TonB family protein
MTPLEWSIRWGHRDVFTILIAKLPLDFSPATYAHCIQLAVHTDIEVLTELFRHDVSKRLSESDIQEILYDAAYGNASPATIQLLLKQYPVGIDVKVREVGHTMLFVAVQDNNIQLARWLLDQGASREITLTTGNSLISQARTEEMRVLLRSYTRSDRPTASYTFDAYDREAASIIDRGWRRMEGMRTSDQGQVMVQFVLHHDGSVTDAKIVECTASRQASNACLLVVSNLTFAKWPSDMRRVIGDTRPIRYTFNYK